MEATMEGKCVEEDSGNLGIYQIIICLLLLASAVMIISIFIMFRYIVRSDSQPEPSINLSTLESRHSELHSELALPPPYYLLFPQTINGNL